jgi:hypothetical protein
LELADPLYFRTTLIPLYAEQRANLRATTTPHLLPSGHRPAPPSIWQRASAYPNDTFTRPCPQRRQRPQSGGRQESQNPNPTSRACCGWSMLLPKPQDIYRMHLSSIRPAYCIPPVRSQSLLLPSGSAVSEPQHRRRLQTSSFMVDDNEQHPPSILPSIPGSIRWTVTRPSRCACIL